MRKLFGFILSLIVIFVMTSCTGSKKSMSSGDSMLSFEDKKNFQYAFFNANREKILGNISKAQALFEQCLKIGRAHV